MSARGTAPGSDPGESESAPPAAKATELTRGLSLGRYLVLERLGEGGMGVVYSSYDPVLDRKVAVKVLRERADGMSAERSNKLMKEAQTLAALSHPNIIAVHDVGTHRNQVFIAMEFSEGGTLKQWLEQRPAWDEVLQRFLEAGEGLAAAHAQGRIHLDFKPENILLDPKRQARVTDFGLSRKGEIPARADAIKGRRVAGTVGYLSPEQVRQQAVDARSDQFSFCLSLHEGLYGVPAFSKDVDLSDPLPAVTPAPSGSPVPGWIRRVLLKGLSEKPADRYGSMPELLSALEARAGREGLINAGVLLSLFAVSALTVAYFDRETPEERAQRACLAQVDRQLEEMWSPARRSAIENSFSGVSATAGAETWVRVRDRLTPHFDEWGQTSRALCVQRDVRWAACLEERRKTLQSMSELFAHADAEVMSHAVNTVLVEVAPAASCRATVPATAGVARSAASDERLRSGLARARVLRAAGKLTEGIGEARAVAQEARGLKATHVEAEAMLLVGEVSAELHRPDAEQNLLEAIVAAERVGNDEIRTRGWIALVSWYSSRDRFDEAEQANRHARSILQRLHDPPLLLASQLTSAGILASTVEGVEAGRQSFEEALQIRQALLVPGHPSLMRSLNNLGTSLPADQGLPLLTQVLETRKSLFGPNHPETAAAHQNVGIALGQKQEYAAALEHLQTALAIRLKDPAADRALLGKLYAVLGTTLSRLGRRADAEPDFRLAVEALREGGALPEEQAEALRKLLDVMGQLKRPASERKPFEDQLRRLEE